jgi:hypothetical protein
VLLSLHDGAFFMFLKSDIKRLKITVKDEISKLPRFLCLRVI